MIGKQADQLKDYLRQIAADYDRCTTDGERRDAALQNLMVIATELQHRGIPGDVLRPLTAVIHALIDVQNGKHSPIFQPPKKAGRPALPIDELRQRGLAAAAVTLFIRDFPEEEALQMVEAKIRKWRAARLRRGNRGKNQPLIEALRDWRGEAMAGGSRADAAIYTKTLAEAQVSAERYGASASDFATSILTDFYKLYR